MRVCARQGEDKAALVKEVAQALYASKICSYAQGMNIIRAKSMAQNWGIEMGSLARIWKARRCMSVHGGPFPLCMIMDLVAKAGLRHALLCFPFCILVCVLLPFMLFSRRSFTVPLDGL